MAVRTIACLPAIVGSWRHAGGGAMLSTSGAYDFDMDRLTRPDLSPPGTRTDQHEPARRGARGRAARARRSTLCTSTTRNPAAVTPNQAKVIQGLMRDDLFTVVHELFADRHGRLRRRRPAGHLAARARRPARLVRASRGDVQPPRDRTSSASADRTTTSSGPWPSRLGFEPELFPDDETLIREALDGGPTLRGITLERLEAEGSVRLNLPENYAPVRRRRVPHPLGQVRAVLRTDAAATASTRCPRTSRPSRTRRPGPTWPRRYPIQLLSPPRPQFLNSTFANSARHRAGGRRPDDRDGRRRRPLPRPRRRPVGRGLQRPRRRSAPACRSPRPSAPASPSRPGIYWNKLSPGRLERQQHHLRPPSPTWGAAPRSSTTSSRSGPSRRDGSPTGLRSRVWVRSRRNLASGCDRRDWVRLHQKPQRLAPKTVNGRRPPGLGSPGAVGFVRAGAPPPAAIVFSQPQSLHSLTSTSAPAILGSFAPISASSSPRRPLAWVGRRRAADWVLLKKGA